MGTYAIRRAALDEGSARRRGLYLYKTEHSLTNIKAIGWIRTRNPRKASGHEPTPYTAWPMGEAKFKYMNIFLSTFQRAIVKLRMT
jgi:hypothetical protein